MVYSVETVTETLWASFLLSFSPPPPPPLVFFLLLFSGKLWRLIIIFIIINANNDRFAVYATGTFQHVIWCQFVADVKGNPGAGGGGVPVTVKYRRPYAITVVTDSILYIMATIFGGAVVNSNRAHKYNRAVGRRAFR